MSARLLVVEDEAPIADFLVRGLREEGFGVEHAPETSVFMVRDLLRTAASGATSTVRVILGNPEKITVENFPPNTDWYQVEWQVMGLESPTGMDTPVRTHTNEGPDPLSPFLDALQTIRHLLSITPSGQSGALTWPLMPDDPTWGLPDIEFYTGEDEAAINKLDTRPQP